MPTTSPRLIAEVLETLSRLDDHWCVLHREDELLSGNVTSDVDLLVSRSPRVVAHQLGKALADRGIWLVQTWEYDRCERSNTFVSLDPPEAVQIDLVFDPHGKGVCGYRSPLFLAAAVPGHRWATLAPLDSLLYRTRKRQVKKNVQALRSLRAERDGFSVEELEQRARAVFEPHARAALLALLKDPEGLRPVGWNKGNMYSWGTLGRRLRRLLVPPGVLLVVPAGAQRASQTLELEFSRLFVDTASLRVSGIEGVWRLLARMLKPSVTIVEQSGPLHGALLFMRAIRVGVGQDWVQQTLLAMHPSAMRSTGR